MVLFRQENLKIASKFRSDHNRKEDSRQSMYRFKQKKNKLKTNIRWNLQNLFEKKCVRAKMFGKYLQNYLQCPKPFVQVLVVRQADLLTSLSALSLSHYDSIVNIVDGGHNSQDPEDSYTNLVFTNIKSFCKYIDLFIFFYFNFFIFCIFLF